MDNSLPARKADERGPSVWLNVCHKLGQKAAEFRAFADGDQNQLPSSQEKRHL